MKKHAVDRKMQYSIEMGGRELERVSKWVKSGWTGRWTDVLVREGALVVLILLRG